MPALWKFSSARWLPWCALAISIAAALAAQAAAPVSSPPAAAAPGKHLFDRWCAECHAPGAGHPGTQQLAWTRGSKLAVLEQRVDLSPALIRYVVRNGQAAMPAYRPTEITDAELDQIAEYLAPPKKR